MVKIEVKDGVANVYTPYSAEFVKKIKEIGGSKWDSVKKCRIVSFTVRVIEDPKPDRKTLMEERERLLARLNEINDLLDLQKGDE